MSSLRIKDRIEILRCVGCFRLDGYDLRFHKVGKDGSAKCDAYKVMDDSKVYGVVYKIREQELSKLDLVEGLGSGYDRTTVILESINGQESIEAFTYVATLIDEKLQPLSWYVNHVLRGALESNLPIEYIERKIKSIASVNDKDVYRERLEQSIYL